MQLIFNRAPTTVKKLPLAFVFDIHGVLADMRVRRIFHDESEIAFLEGTVAKDKELWEAADTGTPQSVIIAMMAEKWPQYRYLYEKFMHHYVDTVVLNQDVINIAMQLKYMGCHVSILSNIPEQDVPELLWHFPIFRMFDAHTFSGYVRLRKPQPEIFEYHTNAFNLVPSECFLIDDVVANVDAAKACGWDGYTYDNIFNLEKMIKEKFGIIMEDVAMPMCTICREEIRKG